MRMVGVGVDNPRPFEFGAKLTLDSAHESFGVLCQIHSVAKFWGDDQLEKAFIAGALPRVQASRYVNVPFSGVEPDYSWISPLGGALPGEVTPMSLPLARGLVPRLGYSDGATLLVRSSTTLNLPADRR